VSFKLGTSRKPISDGGVVDKKLSFKSSDASIPGTPVIRKNLQEGILGEANMDGSIYISNTVQPGSQEERQVLIHEMRHATDMKLGRLAYNDDGVYYDGITYPRETINGRDMIMIDGQWKEAGDDFPWEKTANI